MEARVRDRFGPEASPDIARSGRRHRRHQLLLAAPQRRGGAAAILSDINPSMLRVGLDRAVERGLIGGLSPVVADAEHLPLPDRCVDRVSIAFGLRNVAR